MKTPIKCDIAIIGAGAAGLSVAAGAAQLGAKVVLIENQQMGGECLNAGCVPSKALLAAAKTCWQAKNSHHMGIQAQVEVDFAKVMLYVKQVIAEIAPNDSVERFEQLGVTVTHATASFIDEHTLQAGDDAIHARYFVIATGSMAFVPAIAGLENIPYLTNESIFTLTTLPQHLIIIGGGAIGCEMAQAFAMLGAQVTLIEAAALLPKDDSELVGLLREQLQGYGITIYEQASIDHISNTASNIEIHLTSTPAPIVGTHLLIATGRKPVIDTLNLAAANVLHTPRGIQVDTRLRTANTKIFAIGDVIGQYQFTHIANYQAGLIIRQILFKLPVKTDYRVIPWVTYTFPELAHAGLTWEQAQQHDKTAKILSCALMDNDRAHTDNETSGKIKIIVDKKARVLGVSILSAHAGELLLPWILLIRERKSLRSLTDAIIPYPTLSEINKRVASEFYKPVLFSKKVRWLVKWLAKF